VPGKKFLSNLLSPHKSNYKENTKPILIPGKSLFIDDPVDLIGKTFAKTALTSKYDY